MNTTATNTVIDPTADTFDTVSFFEKVVSLVPGIVYVFNQKTMANEYSNRSIATLLGYSSDEIIKMGDALLQTVIHPDDLEGLVAYFASLQSLADGEVANFRYRIYALDGSVLWLSTIDTVFERAADGSVLRHIGVASDATEQVSQNLELAAINMTLEMRIAERTSQLAALNATLETKVQDRTSELLCINDELEQLTYIATHDLKVPITNLTHLTQILAEDTSGLNKEQCDVVGWMGVSCAQANGKVAVMVQVAHARSAELKQLEPVNLRTVAETSCRVLEHEIKASTAVISFDFDAGQSVEYLAFESASIFDNLIGNALKYAHPDRTPQVHLRTQMGDDHILLTVRDNGTGLNLPTDEEKVFGLFKRAHVEPPGSGIALYSIRKTLERYGGDIQVDSVLGEWTEFQISFPKLSLVNVKEDA